LSDETKTFTIGGREFRAVEASSLEHDHFTTEAAGALGLKSLQLGPGETPGEFGVRLFNQALKSGSAWPLLGALIVPADIADADWSPKYAESTGAFLRKQSDPTDKATIRQLLASTLIGFFGGALGSSQGSGTSSILDERANQQPGGAIDG
jgi:hypothetical protein